MCVFMCISLLSSRRNVRPQTSHVNDTSSKVEAGNLLEMHLIWVRDLPVWVNECLINGLLRETWRTIFAYERCFSCKHFVISVESLSEAEHNFRICMSPQVLGQMAFVIEFYVTRLTFKWFYTWKYLEISIFARIFFVDTCKSYSRKSLSEQKLHLPVWVRQTKFPLPEWLQRCEERVFLYAKSSSHVSHLNLFSPESILKF